MCGTAIFDTMPNGENGQTKRPLESRDSRKAGPDRGSSPRLRVAHVSQRHSSRSDEIRDETNWPTTWAQVAG